MLSALAFLIYAFANIINGIFVLVKYPNSLNAILTDSWINAVCWSLIGACQVALAINPSGNKQQSQTQWRSDVLMVDKPSIQRSGAAVNIRVTLERQVEVDEAVLNKDEYVA